MSTSQSATERLREIERILSHRTSPPSATDVDVVAVHLAGMPSDRLHGLTAVLQQRAGEAIDDVDAVALRLLLNDYVDAVAHLRAVAHNAASRIDAAAATVRASEEIVRKQLRKQEKNRISRQQTGEESSSPQLRR